MVRPVHNAGKVINQLVWLKMNKNVVGFLEHSTLFTIIRRSSF